MREECCQRANPLSQMHLIWLSFLFKIACLYWLNRVKYIIYVPYIIQLKLSTMLHRIIGSSSLWCIISIRKAKFYSMPTCSIVKLVSSVMASSLAHMIIFFRPHCTIITPPDRWISLRCYMASPTWSLTCKYTLNIIASLALRKSSRIEILNLGKEKDNSTFEKILKN